MDLDELIKKFNLVFTDTIKKRDLYRVDLDKTDANIDNSISLYDLVTSFNKLYNDFKKKYDKLEKFDFCKKQYPCRFFEFNFDGYYRVLELLIDGCNPEKFKGNDELELNLEEKDGKNESYATNGANSWDDDYYNEDIEIDNNLVKEYLDLFQEYNFLMELFYRLKEDIVFSDGTFSIVSKIRNGNTIDVMFGEDIDTLKLCIFASYFDQFNEIIITFKLGNDISIDLDNSRVTLNGNKIDINSEMCFDILKRIYLNSKYLEELRSDEREIKGEQKRKILKDNIQ